MGGERTQRGHAATAESDPISDKSGLFCCYAAQFALSNVLGCGPRPTQDKAHEAARIHHASRRRGTQQAEMRRIRASRQRPTDRFGRRRAFYLLNAACKPF